jgi:hypothetical protein
VEILDEKSIVKTANSKTAKEWEKVAKMQTNMQDYYFYNALKRLKIALDKGEKNEIKIWKFIGEKLAKRGDIYGNYNY